MAERIEQTSYQSNLVVVRSMTEAVDVCRQLARKTPKEAAWDLGVKYNHFQRMMNPADSSHFPADLIEEAMKCFGNNFPLDWQARRMGLVCYPWEMMQILEGIRQALRTQGNTPRFAALLEDERWQKFLDAA